MAKGVLLTAATSMEERKEIRESEEALGMCVSITILTLTPLIG